MFLSRIEIDLTSRQGQACFRDLYRFHQKLLLAFPAEAPAGGGRVLFRVEPGRGEGSAVVLVQSECAPDWGAARFTEAVPALRSDGPKEIAIQLRPGDRVRFRMRANPTRRSDGKRLAVTGEAAQLQWLSRKLVSAGLKLDGARLVDEGMVRGRRGGASDSPPMTFISVLSEGVASVVDPAKIEPALASGIGTGKAFGFGLLSLGRL